MDSMKNIDFMYPGTVRNTIRNLMTLVIVALFCFGCSDESENKYKMLDITEYNIQTADLHIRDPFIVVDRKEECYYLIAPKSSGQKSSNLYAYKSLDLKRWKDVAYLYRMDADYLEVNDFWAPDFYEYKGNYYCFVTISGDNFKRGTTILKGGASPIDTYKPLFPKEHPNVTPADWNSLDGSLYIDDMGTPWMIFSHEWIDVMDGEMWALKLKEDLSGAVGEPVKLFSASQSRWAGTGEEVYTTDAPFIWKDEMSGHLIMLWSSHIGSPEDKVYCIGQAISKTGKLEGPWEHDPVPIYSSDGGHAMVFKDLQGKLKIAFHSPNTGTVSVQVCDLTIKDGKFERFDTSKYDPTSSISTKSFEVVYQNIPTTNNDFCSSNMFDGKISTCWMSCEWPAQTNNCAAGDIWCGSHEHTLDNYTFGIGEAKDADGNKIYLDPIYPPYDLVIDMKDTYTLRSIGTMTRKDNAWGDDAYAWEQRVKEYEYWVADATLSEHPSEEDIERLDWKKLGEDTCPVVNLDYRTIETSGQNSGRYLKLKIKSLYFRGKVSEANQGSNPNLGHVCISEIRAKGYKSIQ